MAQMIRCPECDKQLQLPEDLLGKPVQCPGCQRMFDAALPEPPQRPKRTDEDLAERPIRRSDRKPSKVQTIGVLSLVGGIFAIMLAIGAALGTSGGCCLWPGVYYSLVLGIMAIVRGSAILGDRAYLEKPPTGLAIMHLVNIINLDITNLVIGIVLINYCNDEEVKEYMAK